MSPAEGRGGVGAYQDFSEMQIRTRNVFMPDLVVLLEDRHEMKKKRNDSIVWKGKLHCSFNGKNINVQLHEFEMKGNEH